MTDTQTSALGGGTASTTRFRTPKRAVAAMFFLNGSLFGIWASRIPAFVERLGMDERQLGLVLLCLAAGAIVSFPLAGVLSDRYGAAALTRLAALSNILTLGLLPLVAAPLQLALALGFFGVTHGMMDVAMNGWGAEVERRTGRTIMSFLHATFSLGAGLGAATGAAVIALGLSVALHFWVFALVLGALMLAMAAIDWPRSEPTPRKKGAPLFSLPHGGLILVGLVAFCSSMGEGAMADWSAVFLNTVSGMGEAQAALGYAAFSTAMVLMRLIGDRVVTRFGPILTLRASGLVSAAGILVILIGGAGGLALFGFALVGLGYANVMPIAFSRAANDPHTPSGQAIAAMATLGYGGILLGPPIIGFVAALTSLSTSFLLLGALALAIVVLAGSVRRA